MPDVSGPLELLLHRPPPSEAVAPGQATLEVTVYWRDDYLDGLEAGSRRRIRVGGTRRNDLKLELPEGVPPFTLAEIGRDEARVRVPAGSTVALRLPDGGVERGPDLEAPDRSQPFAEHRLGLGERLVFTVGELTFSLQFVRDHRNRQSIWQRIRPRDL